MFSEQKTPLQVERPRGHDKVVPKSHSDARKI
jgi:hypothetical protein